MSAILFNFYSNVTCTIQFFIPPWITITFPIIADAFVIAIDITWTVKHCKNNRIGLRFPEKEILSISGERKIDRIYFSENLGLQTGTFQKHLAFAILGLISLLKKEFSQKIVLGKYLANAKFD